MQVFKREKKERGWKWGEEMGRKEKERGRERGEVGRGREGRKGEEGRREESSELNQDLLQGNYWLFQIFQGRQKPM